MHTHPQLCQRLSCGLQKLLPNSEAVPEALTQHVERMAQCDDRAAQGEEHCNDAWENSRGTAEESVATWPQGRHTSSHARVNGTTDLDTDNCTRICTASGVDQCAQSFHEDFDHRRMPIILSQGTCRDGAVSTSGDVATGAKSAHFEEKSGLYLPDDIIVKICDALVVSTNRKGEHEPCAMITRVRLKRVSRNSPRN